ncbi:MAG: hypothetical protein D8M57_04630 [Candidatus Scalindua sp. AMX11]|nr:MAG: hypothetical protein DWQ00_03965 [Candidatus Scalindua sp.]NOG84601.1 hypothetical protein [Planctomycetota bacterium]RZV92375.1 MAG: hypothetical protein EX341_04820 [Candidatus Scalindua sp. SCAELEC01]TDE66100.1 MAG: hypothetical protein D8M57_04630 [Candidatus Scalindua sp. AMX11]GJQ59074.1 MAG: lipid A biosynthesis protein [Candidatus Scalindua sp.]
MLDVMIGHIWIVVGVFGQILFFLRFFVQWLASEKAGKSVIPIAFWYFSIVGGLTLLAYALWRKDPVFILGQSIGIAIYTRNLYLVRKEAKIAKERQKTDAYV